MMISKLICTKICTNYDTCINSTMATDKTDYWLILSQCIEVFMIWYISQQ